MTTQIIDSELCLLIMLEKKIALVFFFLISKQIFFFFCCWSLFLQSLGSLFLLSQDFLISFIANVVSANGDAEKQHWELRSAGVNMDTVVSGLQQKLQNLKAQGQKNESSDAAATLTTTEETGDFKMAFRKFSEHGDGGPRQNQSLPKMEKRTKKKTEENNGIKIVNGKEEFTIDFEQEQKLNKSK